MRALALTFGSLVQLHQAAQLSTLQLRALLVGQLCFRPKIALNLPPQRQIEPTQGHPIMESFSAKYTYLCLMLLGK